MFNDIEQTRIGGIMKELKIDPEFQALIPPLSGEEFSQLEENVKSDGCRDALVVWQGIIVDGHNRYKICRENNISFHIEEKDFADRYIAVEWIIRNQFGRRNLSPAQRCELAMKLKTRIQEQAKENQGGFKGNQYKIGSRQNSDKDQKIDTYDELAKIAGVSSDTIRKTEKILKKGTPEQIERARKGGKGNSVNAVHNEIVGKKETTKHEAVDNSSQVPVSRFKASESFLQELAGVKSKCEQMTKEEKALLTSVIKSNKYNGENIVYTIGNVVDEINANFQMYLRSLESTLQQNTLLIKEGENNKKIMTKLSEAALAIEKLKGKYLI